MSRIAKGDGVERTIQSEPAGNSPQKPYSTASVVSSDGTTIGYRRLGHGPGVILVHGSMMGAQNFMKLAAALAGDCTVYIPDRRGRGLSGPHGDYSLEREADDIRALVKHSAASSIFGLSSGAIVTLKAALSEPTLRNVAL